MKKHITKPCDECGKMMSLPPSRDRIKTCSRKCFGLRRSRLYVGKNGTSWRGGNFIDKDGYKMIRVGGKKKYKREHHLVIEKRLGREIKKGEVVHHWDEDRLNNKEDNLAFLRHQAAHLRLHKFAARHGIAVELLKFDQPWLA